jgi:hypothetical protein
MKSPDSVGIFFMSYFLTNFARTYDDYYSI